MQAVCLRLAGRTLLCSVPLHASKCPCLPERAAGLASTSGPGLTNLDQRRTSGKTRLDEYVLKQYPEYSRNLIQSWITQGKVLVNDRVVTKAGHPVSPSATVRVNAEDPKFVCRAGFKLEAALNHFGVDVSHLVVLDSGLSSGGFTDCLLQHGAKHVSHDCTLDIFGQHA